MKKKKKDRQQKKRQQESANLSDPPPSPDNCGTRVVPSRRLRTFQGMCVSSSSRNPFSKKGCVSALVVRVWEIYASVGTISINLLDTVVFVNGVSALHAHAALLVSTTVPSF